MNHPAVTREEESAEALRMRFERLKEQNPKIRALDAAKELGVSEGELLAARVGHEAVRLSDSAQAILESVEPLGEVMALTRNPHCVHERKGVYSNASFNNHGKMHVGLLVNPDIDLRLFMDHWKFCYAVAEGTGGSRLRKSLQFFDKSGVALHKIYLTPKSDEAAYDRLVERFTAQAQPTTIDVEAYPRKAADAPDSAIDWPAFRTAWENLKDTHDFHPMLRKFKVGREQGFRHVGTDFAYRVSNNAARQVLDLARDKDCEIMVFVGNRGCIQIHTGPVKKLLEHGPWYNVMDPQFNLHLREDHIAATWVTLKPTEDGIVTALELFDADGEIIATFFGKRKPGIPELELWREIIKEIPPLEDVDVA